MGQMRLMKLKMGGRKMSTRAARWQWRASLFFGLLVLAGACGASGKGVRTGASTGVSAPVQADSKAALDACEGAGLEAAGGGVHSNVASNSPTTAPGTGPVLRAAFAVAGSAIPGWQETRSIQAEQAQAQAQARPTMPVAHGPGIVTPFATAHASDPTVYICYFDGQFYISKPPDSHVPTPNRLRVLVAANGDAAWDVAAYHDTPGHADMTFSRPS
jgi:hypothetical protein